MIVKTRMSLDNDNLSGLLSPVLCHLLMPCYNSCSVVRLYADTGFRNNGI